MNQEDRANPQRRPTRRLGVTLTGKKIWVSELVSIILLCVLLVPLLYISAVIIRNELAIHYLDREIAELKAEKVNLTRILKTMHERDRIANILNEVAGRRLKPETIHTLADLVYQNSQQYGYDPELLLAVIAVESRFDSAALGRYRSGNLSGALGLMQIKYPTALEVARTLGIRNLKEEDLFDPEINILLGTAYLTQLITRFRSLKLGILAYNLGPGTVRGTLSRREQLPIRYYEKVIAQYYKFKAIGRDEY